MLMYMGTLECHKAEEIRGLDLFCLMEGRSPHRKRGTRR